MSDGSNQATSFSAPSLTTYPELAGYPMVLTIKETAEVLRISREYVRLRCLDGTIQSIRLGNQHRIPRTEILRLLSAN